MHSNPEMEHVKIRGGEAYGGTPRRFPWPHHRAGFITLFPLSKIQGANNKTKYLDYILRHEGGHLIGSLSDLPQETEDNIMKPPTITTYRYLKKKNINFTPEQIRAMKQEIEEVNLTTISIGYSK